jgi:hypothetical protein
MKCLQCAAVAVILSGMVFVNCPAGMVTGGADIKLVNSSGSEVTNINLLFAGQTKQKLSPKEEFTTSFSWQGADPHESSDHIEYTLGGRKYDKAAEHGAFAGKALRITGGTVLITFYASYYTLEIKT